MWANHKSDEAKGASPGQPMKTFTRAATHIEPLKEAFYFTNGTDERFNEVKL